MKTDWELYFKNQMNETIRGLMKDRLAECSDAQQLVFKRMYANGNLETPIDTVIDNMPDTDLVWAYTQIVNTTEKNEKRELDFYAELDIVRA